MDNGRLKAISHELQTQDNRITADPLFCVFEKERIYGVSTDYTDTWERCNSDQQCSCEPDEPCDYFSSKSCRKNYYVERDHFVNAHFTEKAAKYYIDTNGYNHNQPFIYVTSLYRCPEMIAIRDALLNGELQVKTNKTEGR